MLPLVDKPIIQYVVEEAVASGIQQIIIVTAGGKRAIEDHFDRSFELEHALIKKGDERLLNMVRTISDLADICYIRQKEQLGVGHAIYITRDLVGNEPFAVIFPDDVIQAERHCLRQMIEVYEQYQHSVLAVERVPREEVYKYGVIEPRPIGERLFEVLGLVEKPPVEEAPSDLTIVGRYILDPAIFEVLARTQPGRLNEIQLTDALALLLQRQPIYAYEFEGTRYDTGTPLGFLKASVDMALKRPDVGPEFRAYLAGVTAALDGSTPRSV